MFNMLRWLGCLCEIKMPRWWRFRRILCAEALQDVCCNSLQTDGVAEEIEDLSRAMVSQHACVQRVNLRGEGTKKGCREAGPEGRLRNCGRLRSTADFRLGL